MSRPKQQRVSLKDYLVSTGRLPLSAGTTPAPDLFAISCEEVEKNLSAFAQTPEKLPHAKFTKIGVHVLECAACRQRFGEGLPFLAEIGPAKRGIAKAP